MCARCRTSEAKKKAKHSYPCLAFEPKVKPKLLGLAGLGFGIMSLGAFAVFTLATAMLAAIHRMTVVSTWSHQHADGEQEQQGLPELDGFSLRDVSDDLIPGKKQKPGSNQPPTYAPKT